MATTTWDPGLSMRDARARFFADAGLPPDGGVDEKWVKLKMGPIPFAIPNTKSRRRAVKLHDLHHILTGYRTDWAGECQISAWEVASSCRDFFAAWVLNLQGMALGYVIAPRRTFRAFVRGRHTRNLYTGEYSDALLDRTVGDLRRDLALDGDAPRATAGDVAAYVAWAALIKLPILVAAVAIAWHFLRR